MATVTPTILSITLYTVQNCSFLLSDVRATKKIEEFGSLTTNLVVAEDVLAVVEKLTNSFTKKSAESFIIAEKAARSLAVNKNEALAFLDVWGRTGRFYLLLAEGVFLADNGVKELTKPVKEYLTLGSATFRLAGVNKNENLTIGEFFSRLAVFDIRLWENIAVVPRTDKNIAVSHAELFSISDRLFKFFEAWQKESAGVDDKFSGKSVFKRTFAETIVNSTKLLKTFNLSRREFIEAFDAYIRHANAVISDICLGAGEMTLEGFLDKTSSPPGYDRFIEFVVGEYEYRDALVRMVVESGSAKSEPLVYDMAVNVDIDDTVDRGTTQITDITRPTTIKFNKHYYHPPEVGVAVKGGTGTNIITAEIGEIREDGFDVSLYNSSRARVAGAITWTAVGY